MWLQRKSTKKKSSRGVGFPTYRWGEAYFFPTGGGQVCKCNGSMTVEIWRECALAQYEMLKFSSVQSHVLYEVSNLIPAVVLGTYLPFSCSSIGIQEAKLVSP